MEMSANQPVTGALLVRTGSLELQGARHKGRAQSTYAQRLIAGVRKIQADLGPSGIAVLSSGIAVALCCTTWAVQLDVPFPLALMAGHCTVLASACLCVVLRVAQNPSVKSAPIASRQPNYAAWRLVSKLSVSDASRL